MDKEKHVTTACYGGGNKYPWGLCYNYFSSSIINIRVRRIKNDHYRVKTIRND